MKTLSMRALLYGMEELDYKKGPISENPQIN